MRKATSASAEGVSCQPPPGSTTGGGDTRRWAAGIRRALASRFGLLSLLALVLLTVVGVATAASASELSLSAADGTTVFDEQLYAKEGGMITAAVTTTADTECVVIFVNGDPVTSDTSPDGATSWTLSFVAGAGDGVRQVRATAYSTTSCEHSEGSATQSIVLDNTGPVVQAKPSPTPNDAGWNNVSPVTVIWSAVDDGFSGVLIEPSPRREIVDGETSGTTLEATATDRLGNVGEGETVVKIDITPPEIVGERVPAANGFGWNNSPVTVAFRCTDGLSGIASCSPPQSVQTAGTTAAVRGRAVDVAGNDSTAAVGPIKIDMTPPTVVIKGVTDGAVYRFGSVPLPSCAALDDLAGPDGCTGQVTSVGEGPLGLFTYAARATDKAGNAAERSVSYRVIAAVSTFSIHARLRAPHPKVSARVGVRRRRGALAGTLTVDASGQNRLVWHMVLRGLGLRRTRAELRIGKSHRRVGLTLCKRCRLRTHGSAVVSDALARQIISHATDIEVRLGRRAAPLLVGPVRVKINGSQSSRRR